MEAIESKLEAKDFHIQMAGAPYIAEMMRRSLTHDFRTFSLTSFLLFGAAMWVLFRSWKLTVGILATCSSAVLLTLLLQQMLGQKIGILTANLITIIFVITLSHLVYMTFNWQTLAQGDQDGDQGKDGPAQKAPQPNQGPAQQPDQRGLGGTFGTILALVTAYLMYPSFLDWERPSETRGSRAPDQLAPP